ncbi:MAG: ankyrin repeat domain-containing protein [Rhodocyclales bacterium GT-UBC]|nr:MAG: ankyrin repeat domain-containing protein [Rhodocyclales bacterium GT-UBC]
MSGKHPSPSKLISAIRKGYLRTVIDALDEGADIEEADIHGHPGLPLRTACFEGDLAIINELIQRGANINAPGADGPGMPLRLAVRAKNSKVIALLLKEGAIIPEHFRIPPALLEEPAMVELPPLDIPLDFDRKPNDLTETEINNYDIIENIDIQSSRGTDTNILTRDLMNLQDAPDSKKTSRR